ncbi:MAG: SMI1/KNR4 family protein [Clostridium baratii]|uniref:SMI1/KNR4 family protein n=1 Tax=Clostridium baratii TaxID=1561 RepID=UPI0024320CE3|nr:SMI1/KNR4 family protein [Clostridium baratii]MBS6043168.1 SMI1/KNR4 family protein [Clostridium baratii]
MKLVWKDAYDISNEELNERIKKFEREYDIEFPELYVDMLYKKAKRVLSCEVMLKGYEDSEDYEEIYFNSFEDNTISNMFISNEQSRDVRPRGIIFFAYTSGGNYYGFDFKDSQNDPKIVFYDHNIVPPREDVEYDEIKLQGIEETQRKYYKTVYDNIEDLYKHLEIAQKYWIELEYGSEDNEKLLDYIKRRCVE